MTGTLKETRIEHMKIEWRIDDFLSLTGSVGSEHDSPRFMILDQFWSLTAYPHGTKEDEEYIGLNLYKCSSSSPITVIYELAIQKADGTESPKGPFTYRFSAGDGYGEPKMLKRSELEAKKSVFLPSGALTFTCTLRSGPPVEGRNSLSADLKNLLVSSAHSDTTLQLQGEQIKAHKAVLSARSPVFAAMFRYDMVENSSEGINVQDCDPNAFKDFLHFLYTDRADINSTNVFHLFTAADKYLVPELMSECVNFILGRLSVDNVCYVYALAYRHQRFDLKIHCKKMFVEKSREILRSPKWKSFLKDNLEAGIELLDNLAEKL